MSQVRNSIPRPIIRFHQPRVGHFKDWLPTILVLFGCLLTTILPEGNSYDIIHQASLIMGWSLTLSIVAELKRDLKNLMRVDLLMLVALYGLIYSEFLVPQPQVVYVIRPSTMGDCVQVVSVGFLGIALGRHWPILPGLLCRSLGGINLTPRALKNGLLICAAIGYFHMLWAVNFDPLRLFNAMLEPRFSQPWGRGRFGGWADLIKELGLLIYLIPPAVGVVLAKSRKFTLGQRWLAYALLAFTLFQGFASGTRNVFVVYVFGLLGGYFLTARRVKWRRMTFILLNSGVIILIASQLMLEFRTIGLGSYLRRLFSNSTAAISLIAQQENFLIDYNIYTLSRIVEYFPERCSFLGLEVPYWALVKPIPRALWPGKPVGLSVSIEEARDEKGAGLATWSATFLGEAYMASGLFSVALFSLLFGIIAAWWNTLLGNSEEVYLRLLYASGMFAALITMRSLFWFTTAILPTVTLFLYGQWILRRKPGSVFLGDRQHG